MAYWMDVWSFQNSNEYEIKFAGNWGAKGEKREKKKKASPEQIKKQNQINKQKKARRTIKANFIPGDIWATLKYPKGTRKTLKEIQKDLEKFWRVLRREYRKRGEELKYFVRKEIGAHGGIHIHILINRLKGGGTDLLIQEIWEHGRVNYTSLYEAGGYEQLADYITKQPEEETEEYKQLSLFDEKEKKQLVSYSTSRNLIRPVPERRVYRRWTVRDLVKNGPKPKPGYYIDKNSIRCGKNYFTGMSYYQYTEVKIQGNNTGVQIPDKGG